jgi:hypothetical protein
LLPHAWHHHHDENAASPCLNQSSPTKATRSSQHRGLIPQQHFDLSKDRAKHIAQQTNTIISDK